MSYYNLYFVQLSFSKFNSVLILFIFVSRLIVFFLYFFYLFISKNAAVHSVILLKKNKLLFFLIQILVQLFLAFPLNFLITKKKKKKKSDTGFDIFNLFLEVFIRFYLP